jgi:hypothetical protein
MDQRITGADNMKQWLRDNPGRNIYVEAEMLDQAKRMLGMEFAGRILPIVTNAQVLAEGTLSFRDPNMLRLDPLVYGGFVKL